VRPLNLTGSADSFICAGQQKPAILTEDRQVFRVRIKLQFPRLSGSYPSNEFGRMTNAPENGFPFPAQRDEGGVGCEPVNRASLPAGWPMFR
jgi:hypothetical protein